MGYELSIQRINQANQISTIEWQSYIESDVEFDAIEELSIELKNGKVLTIPIPNAGLWKSSLGEVPFTFSEEIGWVSVKNPDSWVIAKMISIANQLDAIVLGEEGELYDQSYLNKESQKESKPDDKRWWEFWK